MSLDTDHLSMVIFTNREPIRAHLPKGRAAKLKTYIVPEQRTSAGEAHGAGRSIKASHGLRGATGLLSCRSF